MWLIPMTHHRSQLHKLTPILTTPPPQDATIMMVKPMVVALSISQLHTVVAAGMASIDAGMIPIFQSIGVCWG